jgi:hypothetical protein
MNDEIRHSPAQTEFEREDLGARPILVFMVWLAVGLVVLGLIVAGASVLMDRYEAAHQPQINPLKPAAPVNTRQASRADAERFPEPRLEVREGEQLDSDITKEEQQLNSYGWMDEKAGSVHIPIERAMQLVAQRGLPVRPEESGTK